MKRLFTLSKQKVLDTLKYLSSIMDILANIFKSFATIVASLFAGVTAGVTGYYEVKKTVKKERAEKPIALTRASGHSLGHISTTAKTMSPAPAPTPIEPIGYYVDKNTGAFLVSIIVLAVLIFKKIKKPKL